MPADRPRAPDALQRIDRRCDVRALRGLGHVAGNHVGHGVAVAGDLHAMLLELCDHIGIARGGAGIDRRGRRYREPLQRLDDAEDADAVAVVALAERAEIGVGRASEAARNVGRDEMVRRRLHLVVLDADNHPDGHACAAGPAQRRTFRDRGCVVRRPVVQADVRAHRPMSLKAASLACTAS
jgi:hypothetical protein